MWFSTLSFCHDSIAWIKVVPYKSLPIKIDSGQPAKHIWVRLWNIKTFHLHDFVKFCLCISLHVCVLVWLSRWRSEGAVCVFKCACVWARSRSGGVCVSALFRFVFHVGKKWNRSHLPQIGPPRSGQKDLPKADPSCLPSLPLSGDFHHLAEDALCAKAPLQTHLSLYSEDLCVFTTFLAHVTHFDASCLLICLSQENEKKSPLQCHLPLLSLSVFIVRRIKNCLRLCSALMTPEPCRAFDCATVSIQPLRGGHPQVDWQCLFFFDVLVTFLRRTRGNYVWQKFYFWCFSSSEQYFLCLIKYVFWLAPFVFIILISTDMARRSDGTMWKRRATLCERAAV